MARMETVGIDEIINQMIKMGQQTGEVADEMLKAGALEMKRSWVRTIDKFDFIDSKEMRKHVGYPRKPKTINDVRTIDVYPQGIDKKRKTPIRNAAKAFYLHYGRENMDETHFVDIAEREAKPKSDAAMEARWKEFIEKGS